MDITTHFPHLFVFSLHSRSQVVPTLIGTHEILKYMHLIGCGLLQVECCRVLSSRPAIILFMLLKVWMNNLARFFSIIFCSKGRNFILCPNATLEHNQYLNAIIVVSVVVFQWVGSHRRGSHGPRSQPFAISLQAQVQPR